MISLGIESTAHTFGVGIVDENCKVLANEKHALMKESTGLIPRELMDHHLEFAEKVLIQALDKAKISLKEVDLISFSQGPGIGQALKVGATTARTLSLLHDKPLIGVNHCIAHVEIGKKLTLARNPISVYASGANTQIIGFEAGRYRVYGETLDIGIGNLLDSFGREIGIGFPAGPKISEMYYQGKNLIELPYTVKGMDLVFSGLFTEAVRMIGKVNEIDLAFSLMHTAFAMLAEVTERALAHTEKNELLLVGGVGASTVLQEMLKEMCEQRNAKLFFPERQFLVDNAAMIAWTGLISFANGNKLNLFESEILPYQRADQVQVNWVK